MTNYFKQQYALNAMPIINTLNVGKYIKSKNPQINARLHRIMIVTKRLIWGHTLLVTLMFLQVIIAFPLLLIFFIGLGYVMGGAFFVRNYFAKQYEQYIPIRYRSLYISNGGSSSNRGGFFSGGGGSFRGGGSSGRW